MGRVSSIERAHCAAIAHVAIHADAMTGQFAAAIAKCTELAPTGSVQIHTKSWSISDAGNVLLFSNEPRQITLSTPFVKPLANFMVALPAGCREIILPKFGSANITADMFSQLVAAKRDADEKFRNITVGDCKVNELTKHAVSPQDVLRSLSNIAETITVEQCFSAKDPAPAEIEPIPGENENNPQPQLKLATTVVTSCKCRGARCGVTALRVNVTRTALIVPVATVIIAKSAYTHR